MCVSSQSQPGELKNLILNLTQILSRFCWQRALPSLNAEEAALARTQSHCVKPVSFIRKSLPAPPPHPLLRADTQPRNFKEKLHKHSIPVLLTLRLGITQHRYLTLVCAQAVITRKLTSGLENKRVGLGLSREGAGPMRSRIVADSG